MHHAYSNQQRYNECVDEYKTTLAAIGRQRGGVIDDGSVAAAVEDLPPISKPSKDDTNLCVQQSKRALEHSGSGSSIHRDEIDNKENVAMMSAANDGRTDTAPLSNDQQISVKEATRKFNRIASEEEASKIISPPAKKKPEKVSFFWLFYFVLMAIATIGHGPRSQLRTITLRSKSVWKRFRCVLLTSAMCSAFNLCTDRIESVQRITLKWMMITSCLMLWLNELNVLLFCKITEIKYRNRVEGLPLHWEWNNCIESWFVTANV